MSNEQPDQDQRWRELADLLGLPPDSPAPEPKTKAAPPPPSRPEPRERETFSPPVSAPLREPARFVDEGPVTPFAPTADHVRPDPTNWPVADPEPVSGVEEGERDERGPPPPEEGEEKSRGRRRGRRGRKGRQEPRSAEPGDKAPSQDRGKERAEDERAPRRRRGRTQEPEPVAPRPHEDEADDQPVHQAARADEGDSEDDNLTDWEVPSWTELISSLYRPDR